MTKQNIISIFTGLVKLKQNMVGTAVVYDKLAYFLKQAGLTVNLVIPEASDSQRTGINYYIYDKKINQKIIDQSNIIIFGAYPPIEPMEYAYAKKSIRAKPAFDRKKIITYLWSLAPIGSLEFKDFKSLKRQNELHKFIVTSYNTSLKLSDKIFCRDEHARDIVLGSLISLGKANLKNYQSKRNFHNLIEVAPFGIDNNRPKHKKNIYRGILPGINQRDFLLIWNGGVWNWNDGVELVELMKNIWAKDKKIKLIMQGFHNPDKIYSEEAKKTFALAKKYKLTGKNIFFPANWIPFHERGNYLTESDMGIVTSPDIPESNYFIKTRFYDYLWAELPITLPGHEAFAGEVRKNNLGLILSGNKKQDAVNIIRFSRNKKLQANIKKNIRRYKKNMTWEKGLKPIVNYCLN